MVGGIFRCAAVAMVHLAPRWGNLSSYSVASMWGEVNNSILCLIASVGPNWLGMGGMELWV